MTAAEAKAKWLGIKAETLTSIEAQIMDAWGTDRVQDYVIATMDKEGQIMVNHTPNKSAAERYALADAPACVFERHVYFRRIK